MFNNLTNRLSRLEAVMAGRECTCPPQEPATTVQPGFREVARHAVHLGLLPCPDCGGLRNLIIDQITIDQGDDIELTLVSD